MHNQWWSWLLAAIGITGIWLAGRNNKLGWAIGLGAQLLWLAYAITTQQWGFLATAVAYGFVYARNWRRWYLAERCTALWNRGVGKTVEWWVCRQREGHPSDHGPWKLGESHV